MSPSTTEVRDEWGFDFRSLQRRPQALHADDWTEYGPFVGGARFAIAKSADGVLLRFAGLADFVVFRDRRTVGMWRHPGAASDTLRHLLLDKVVPLVLSLRGNLVLHSGAVTSGDDAIAFMGPSGSGKSTLAASLHVAGHPLLTDDALMLTPTQEGVAVQPIYRSLRLLPESVTRLFDTPPPSTPMAEYSRKQRLELAADTRDTGPMPLGSLFVLRGQHESAAVSIERLSMRDACIAIMEHAFVLDVGDPQRSIALLGAAARVAQRVPVFALSFPHDFDRLAEVHTALLTAAPPRR